MRYKYFIGCILLFSFLQNVSSYEIETHDKISKETIDKIWKNNSSVIDDFNVNYESKFNGKTIRELVGEGTKFEDNNTRPLNHFYDPYNDIGLTFPPGYKSPDWALEDNELLDLPEQEYSLKDASDYFYRALTGKDLPLGETRETNFGKLFVTLGHVIHHVQDMAQPQHVRDDPHCGEKLCKLLEGFGIFNPSLYEELSNKDRDELPFNGYGEVTYSKARDFWHNANWSGMADFTNQNFISIGTNFIENEEGTFTTIADYPEPKPYPGVNNDELVFDDIAEKLPEMNLSGEMAFMPNMVTDRNLVGASATNKNIYGSTFSIFDQDLQLDNACVQYTRELLKNQASGEKLTKTYTYKTCRLFTYNRFNVKAAQDYLIPRAVAYSAGLINYFFRGRLDITKTEQTTDTNGNQIAAITIKNISLQNFNMSSGKLAIFYDALVDGVEIRKQAQFAEGETGDITDFNNGTEKTLKIVLPTDIDTNKENPFVAVYQGVIGEEPGVAGKVFNVRGETAILLFYQQTSNSIVEKRSVDAGKSWNLVNDAAFSNFRLSGPSHKGEHFISSNKATGLIIGNYADGQGYVALRTQDNGKTWSRFLEQSYSQYTEIVNVVNAVHVGDGRLITFNNYFASSFKVGLNTYYSYDVELSESFDDGLTWSPIALPISIEQGGGNQLYYLGNNHLYLLAYKYDFSCNCTQYLIYESFDLGQNFSLVPFSASELEWHYGQWYRDAFQEGKIISTKNVSTILGVEDFRFAISSDGGKTLTLGEEVAKNAAWPQSEPLTIRPFGKGKFVSYVFDPWTAYEKDLPQYYEGVMISEDNGQHWSEVYQGMQPTWDYPWYITMGVLTKDVNAIKYVQ